MLAFSAAGRQFIHVEAVAGTIVGFDKGHIISGFSIKVVKLHDLQSHGCHAQVVEKEEPFLDIVKAGLVADNHYIRVSEKNFPVHPGMFA